MPDLNAKVKEAIDEVFSTSVDPRDDLYLVGQYCDELVESLDDFLHDPDSEDED